MSLLVTGSIAIDTVETPRGRVEDALGGSAIYFSLAASLFTPVRMVGVVGEDFDMQLLQPLYGRHALDTAAWRQGHGDRPLHFPIDTRGVEVRHGSRTFRWHGKYMGPMDHAETVDVKLNVLAEHGAPIPAEFVDSRFVFLANTHPALQRDFARKLPEAELLVCDTMDLWIENEPEELRKTLAVVHGLVLNEGEARLLTQETNLVTAGREVLKMGPRFVIIKKGEHGSLLVSNEDLFLMPPYPTEKVVDPTGCGDSFAGGTLGYLASQGRFDRAALRAAMARGSVVASFVLESFSVEALSRVTSADVEQRLAALREMVRVE